MGVDDSALARHSGERRNPAPLHAGLKQPCVYIMASARNGTLYVGVTSALSKRVHEHRSDIVEGFTKTHRVHILVWFEQHLTMESAILREKAIKEWKRNWNVDLIEKANPYWRDLYSELLDV